MQFPDGTIEVLATSLFEPEAYPSADFAALYYERWGIETLFGSLKARDFNFADIYLIHAERLSKMRAWLAFAWRIGPGELLNEQTPIRLKKSISDRLKCLFRYGLDVLHYIALNHSEPVQSFLGAVNILSSA